jgi:hypothetical protein
LTLQPNKRDILGDKMDEKQTVLLPIIVPKGKFCWNFSSGAICENFDNYEGNNCKFFGWLSKTNDDGVKKHDGCLLLKTK